MAFNLISYGDKMIRFRNAMDHLELAVSAGDFHSKQRQPPKVKLFLCGIGTYKIFSCVCIAHQERERYFNPTPENVVTCTVICGEHLLV